jgi:hypothetical protein
VRHGFKQLFDLLRSSSYSAPSALGHNSIVNLGRWPRLLHFAPLALTAANDSLVRSYVIAVLTILQKPLKRLKELSVVEITSLKRGVNEMRPPWLSEALPL